jgi:hypothetical protein
MVLAVMEEMLELQVHHVAHQQILLLTAETLELLES